MHERLKKLRKALDLTQQKFADKIGMKQNTIAQYEIGRTVPSDAIIFSGEMFLQSNRNADIARLTKELLSEESDSFKNRFISMLANLSVTEWEFLEQKAKELAGINDESND